MADVLTHTELIRLGRRLVCAGARHFEIQGRPLTNVEMMAIHDYITERKSCVSANEEDQRDGGDR